MVNQQKITLYHTNTSTVCTLFIKGCDYLYISDTDGGAWLGKGMYFWDNQSNAKYWLSKRKKSTHIVSVSVDFGASDLLDLTDTDACNYIYNIWLMICKKSGYTTIQELGKILNTIFDHIPEISKKFKIIKVIGNGYSQTSPLFDGSRQRICVSLNSKVIYTVRNPVIINHNSKEVIYSE